MDQTPVDNLIEHNPEKPVRLSNINCVYCGRLFNKEIKKTKEHVIGKSFVPKGTFEGQWNLILNACQNCNNKKSELEGELSAITMQPDAAGRHANEDELLLSEATRKGKGAISNITGMPVKDSIKNMDVAFVAPGFKMNFGLIGPPQADFERVYQLACCHVTGFFFMQSFNKNTRMGGFPLGEFHPLIHADKTDWGNDVMKWFIKETANWDVRLHAITASAYFKIKLWKSKCGVMAWAVEWNQKTRCIGLWGQPNELKDVLSRRPNLKRQRIRNGTKRGLFIRPETALDPMEDILFLRHHSQ